MAERPSAILGHILPFLPRQIYTLNPTAMATHRDRVTDKLTAACKRLACDRPSYRSGERHDRRLRTAKIKRLILSELIQPDDPDVLPFTL